MPSDTQQVMDLTDKLAKLVAEHPAVERLKDAQRAVTEDADASRLMQEFDRQLQRLVQQQQAGMAVTDAQQQQLEALQNRIVSHIKIKALNMAQVDYADLRRRIGQTIDRAVAGNVGAAAGSPTPGDIGASGGPRIGGLRAR